MNRSPITAQNMNGYDFRIEENYLGVAIPLIVKNQLLMLWGRG
jgi:hypothetical protein